MDHLKLLQHFQSFEDGPSVAGAPRFSYAPAACPDLARFRDVHHLDDVAGSGDVASAILNLMKWVHGRIEHDGRSRTPEPRNVFHIIETCDRERRGVNCRMLATILNEAYLALGFKSRLLTCLPHDSEDTDCHVIVMVYADAMEKWLYVDPTFSAYWLSTGGEMRSPAEVRDDLTYGREIATNSDLDRNGKPHDTELYLQYMTKNLFRFTCPLVSSFGYESGVS